ncbi:MAG: lipopolysaccharide kinase InaA family protein [Planctomycetales bacterium]
MQPSAIGQRAPLAADPDCADGSLVPHRAGSMRWEVRPALIAELFDGPDLHVAEQVSAGLAEIVKSGPHRTVYRLHLSGGDYYLKHYRVTDWTGVLRNVVRPCKAAREREAARRAGRLGVRTCEIAGCGYALASGLVRDSFLLTRGVENSVGLDEFATERLKRCPPARQTRLRQSVARRAGELAARLHRGGFLHRDFHSENLLVQVDGDDATIRLIDLHPVDFVRRPTARQIEGNLALLANFLWRHTRPVDRMRFARAWWEMFRRLERERPRGARGNYADFREFVERAGRRCYEGMLRAADVADRRWRRGNRKLIIADSRDGRVACRAVAEFGRPWIEETRDDPERLLSASAVRDWNSRDGAARIAAVTCRVAGLPLHCACRVMPLDAENSKKPNSWFAADRWAPSRRAWEMGHAFLRRGIGAARPLFFVSTTTAAAAAGRAVQRPGCSFRREYLLTEEIPDAVSLATLLAAVDDGSPGESRDRLRRTARLLGDRLRLMRDARFVHFDLNAENVLVPRAANPSGLWFSGMESVHRGSRWPWLFRRQFSRMLARLEVDLHYRRSLTATLRLRFLRRFLGARFADWKRVWREVAREASRLVSGNIDKDADRAPAR